MWPDWLPPYKHPPFRALSFEAYGKEWFDGMKCGNGTLFFELAEDGFVDVYKIDAYKIDENIDGLKVTMNLKFIEIERVRETLVFE